MLHVPYAIVLKDYGLGKIATERLGPERHSQI